MSESHGRPGLTEPLPLEAVYDEATLAAVDSWTPPRRPAPSEAARPLPAGWRGLTAGVALNAMVLGVGDALDDGPVHEAIVELRPAVDGGVDQPVTFVMVPGAPRASRLIVRPWLLAG
jgi:hypothetical protein